jgi:hypothetical protein
MRVGIDYRKSQCRLPDGGIAFQAFGPDRAKKLAQPTTTRATPRQVGNGRSKELATNRITHLRSSSDGRDIANPRRKASRLIPVKAEPRQIPPISHHRARCDARARHDPTSGNEIDADLGAVGAARGDNVTGSCKLEAPGVLCHDDPGPDDAARQLECHELVRRITGESTRSQQHQ